MKFERPPLFVVVMALAAVGLCVAHFVRDDENTAVTKASKPGATKKHDWSREEGQARDAKLMEEFRENRQASVMDSKEEAKNKELTRNLRRYGLNPIEMQGGPMSGSAQGLKVLESDADVRALIESGGYVAGARPESTEEQK